MSEKNFVSLEGVVKKKSVRRSFLGELTGLFLQAPTSRGGTVHVGVLVKLPEEARERIQEGMTVHVEGELDYEKKKSGGYEVFVLARKVKALANGNPLPREADSYAEFDF